ncbi:MAG: glycosyltransferase family 4 protein [Sedimentisphaerales bacterium]|nr:glycosyltransferase family 4 protein [Sedimentisphaerales bacterium]
MVEKMTVRIAIILERADISLGGAQRSVFELAGVLSAQDYKVEVLAAKGKGQTKNVRILCKDEPGRRTGLIRFAKALREYIAEHHYDIVHSTLPFDFVDLYQPRGGCFAESVLRNAASYENVFIERYKRITAFANLRRTILLRAEKKLCKNPDGPVIAALSSYVAEQFKRHYGLGSERVKIIPNGVKINKRVDSSQSNRLREQILMRLSIKEADEPILFLFVANNFRLKGLSSLIRAANTAMLGKSAKSAYLIVAGRDGSGKYRHLAAKLGIEKRVVFLGNLRHIQNALSIADVAVLPTFYDPASRFILEALAAATPVITTRYNGAIDLFVNDRHGRVIERPEDITALADAIAYFSNRQNIEQTSQAIIEDNLKEKVSIARAAKEIKLLYQSIIKERK